ncbi:hypothetical protein DIPPA_24812 [Diplonema papillatum]|nr:hypothetical protein DIPPA_24812 [Diplonema papillatum]
MELGAAAGGGGTAVPLGIELGAAAGGARGAAVPKGIELAAAGGGAGGTVPLGMGLAAAAAAASTGGTVPLGMGLASGAAGGAAGGGPVPLGMEHAAAAAAAPVGGAGGPVPLGMGLAAAAAAAAGGAAAHVGAGVAAHGSFAAAAMPTAVPPGTPFSEPASSVFQPSPASSPGHPDPSNSNYTCNGNVSGNNDDFARHRFPTMPTRSCSPVPDAHSSAASQACRAGRPPVVGTAAAASPVPTVDSVGSRAPHFECPGGLTGRTGNDRGSLAVPFNSVASEHQRQAPQTAASRVPGGPLHSADDPFAPHSAARAHPRAHAHDASANSAPQSKATLDGDDDDEPDANDTKSSGDAAFAQAALASLQEQLKKAGSERDQLHEQVGALQAALSSERHQASAESSMLLDAGPTSPAKHESAAAEEPEELTFLRAALEAERLKSSHLEQCMAKPRSRPGTSTPTHARTGVAGSMDSVTADLDVALNQMSGMQHRNCWAAASECNATAADSQRAESALQAEKARALALLEEERSASDARWHEVTRAGEAELRTARNELAVQQALQHRTLEELRKVEKEHSGCKGYVEVLVQELHEAKRRNCEADHSAEDRTVLSQQLDDALNVAKASRDLTEAQAARIDELEADLEREVGTAAALRDSFTELETEIAQWKSTAKAAEQEASRAEKRSRREIEKKNLQLAEYDEALSRAAACPQPDEAAEWQEKLDEKARQVEQYEATISEIHATVSQAVTRSERQAELLRQDVQSRDATIAELTTALASQRSLTAKLTRDIEDASSAAQPLSDDLQRAREQRDAAEQRASGLQSELDQSRQELFGEQTAMESLEQQVAELQHQQEAVAAEVEASFKAALEEKDEVIAELRSEFDAVQRANGATLKQARENEQRVVTIANDLAAALAEREEEKGNAARELSARRAAEGQRLAAEESYRAEIARLSEQLAAFEAGHADELDHLEALLKAGKREAVAAEAAARCQAAELDALRRQLFEARSALDLNQSRLEAQDAELQQVNAGAAERLAALQAELSLEREQRAASGHRDEEELDAMRRRFDDSVRRIEALEAENAAMADEAEGLRSAVELARREEANSAEEARRAAEHVESMAQDLAAVEERLKEVNAACEAGEASLAEAERVSRSRQLECQMLQKDTVKMARILESTERAARERQRHGPAFPEKVQLALARPQRDLAPAAAAYVWRGALSDAGLPLYTTGDGKHVLEQTDTSVTVSAARPRNSSGKRVLLEAKGLRLDDSTCHAAAEWAEPGEGGGGVVGGVQMVCSGVVDVGLFADAVVQALDRALRRCEELKSDGVAWRDECEKLRDEADDRDAEASDTREDNSRLSRDVASLKDRLAKAEAAAEARLSAQQAAEAVLGQDLHVLVSSTSGAATLADDPKLRLDDRIRRCLLRAYANGSTDSSIPKELRDNPKLSINDRLSRALQREHMLSMDAWCYGQPVPPSDDDVDCEGDPADERLARALRRLSSMSEMMTVDDRGAAPVARVSLGDDGFVPRRLQDGCSLPAAERLVRAARRERWRLAALFPHPRLDDDATLRSRLAYAFKREAWLAGRLPIHHNGNKNNASVDLSKPPKLHSSASGSAHNGTPRQTTAVRTPLRQLK